MISQTDYQNAIDILVASIRENHPSIDTSVGTPVREIDVNVGATIYAILQELISNFQQTNSLKALADSNSSNYSDTLDALLSNWFESQIQGSYAQGYVQILFSSNNTYFIPQTTEFYTVGGLIYKPTADLLVEPEATADASSIKLYPYTTDVYRCIVTLKATETGNAYRLPAGTALNADTLSTSVVSITTFTDFSDARNTETVQTALTRVEEGLSLRELTTYRSIPALLQREFSTLSKVSVIGFQHREMQRDRQTYLGVGHGAKADVYLRTALQNVTLTKTVSATGVVTLTLPTEVPFYRILSISKVKYPGLPLAEAYYSISRSGSIIQTANYLPDVTQAMYTAYETATITITDNTYFGQEVYVNLQQPQLIHEVQSYLNDTTNRCVCFDLLARAFIPCFISFDVTVVLSQTLDTAAVKAALTTYVESVDRLHVSNLVDILKNYEAVVKVQLPLTVTGVLYSLNGSVITLTAEDTLEIPVDYPNSQSRSTVSFFVDTINILEGTL